MPLYRSPSRSTWMTEPTGSKSGSAAAIPFRTFTPDVVVVPRQYAVAVKRRRAPGAGVAVLSRSSAWRAAYRESRIVLSYRKANATAAVPVATILRPNERESNIMTRVGATKSAAAGTIHYSAQLGPSQSTYIVHVYSVSRYFIVSSGCVSVLTCLRWATIIVKDARYATAAMAT